MKSWHKINFKKLNSFSALHTWEPDQAAVHGCQGGLSPAADAVVDLVTVFDLVTAYRLGDSF